MLFFVTVHAECYGFMFSENRSMKVTIFIIKKNKFVFLKKSVLT